MHRPLFVNEQEESSGLDGRYSWHMLRQWAVVSVMFLSGT